MTDEPILSLDAYNKLNAADKGLVDYEIMQNVRVAIARAERDPANASEQDMGALLAWNSHRAGLTETGAPDLTGIVESGIEITRALVSDPMFLDGLRAAHGAVAPDQLRAATRDADALIAVDGDQFDVLSLTPAPTPAPAPLLDIPGRNIT